MRVLSGSGEGFQQILGLVVPMGLRVALAAWLTVLRLRATQELVLLRLRVPRR
jgi:hypothetical protein